MIEIIHTLGPMGLSLIKKLEDPAIGAQATAAEVGIMLEVSVGFLD